MGGQRFGFSGTLYWPLAKSLARFQEPGRVPRISRLLPNFPALIFSWLRAFVPGSKKFPVAKRFKIIWRCFGCCLTILWLPFKFSSRLMSIGIKTMPRHGLEADHGELIFDLIQHQACGGFSFVMCPDSHCEIKRHNRVCALSV